jgi:hypothetical protein
MLFWERFPNWLVNELASLGVAAKVICMEDFGWTNQASYNGVTYLIGAIQLRIISALITKLGM